ncbi:MAG: prolyl oligopeptidase family serine peptidase [Candidatus Aminicenantes bacterium]|nr:MAG: prolyl oligopeptidase family serine peptidase [Candidatus Aminicenantes bacterium]
MSINFKNGSRQVGRGYLIFLLVLVTALVSISGRLLAEKKPLSFQDMMKFKSIQNPVISERGDWVVYSTNPDRGNGEAIAYSVNTGKTFTIPRGAKPVITKDSRWVAAVIQPDARELEKADKKKKPKPGMALLDTLTGKIISVEKVKGFTFAEDSQWLLYRLYPEEKTKDKQKSEEKKSKEDKKETKEKQEVFPLILRHLSSQKEIRIENVGDSALDPGSRYIVYSIHNKGPDGHNNGLYIRELKKNADLEKKIHGGPRAKYSNLTWSKKKSRLAFIFHENQKKNETDKTSKKNDTYVSSLMVWDGLKTKLHTAVSKKCLPQGWMIPSKNQLTWTKDENRLFFGLKPIDEYQWTRPQPHEKKEKEIDLYDINYILEKPGVDVWHWNDPLINPHQKKQWDKYEKRVYLWVFHLPDDWYVQLTDKQVPELQVPENADYALGLSDLPYQKEITWDDRYKDVYLVNLKNGTRRKILTRCKIYYQHNVSLSPQGRFVVYYKDKHWYLYNIRLLTGKNLTDSINTPFCDEDYDYPSDVPGYGVAGWTENDGSVIIYDKYDIWQFFTTTGEALCITNGEGRKNKIEFRIQKLDPEEKFFKKNQKFLLSAYSHDQKYTAFYSCSAGKKDINKLIQGPKRFKFLNKAKKTNRILYTRESFEEFPDLWVSDLDFKAPQKISHVNPQVKNFLWGKAELIEWQSFDGIPLQGAVFKPENFDKNKRYPVLVYFYRKFSNRLYRFNEVAINHRPCFPYYTGHGYVLFLPDIRFEVGRPGFSAAKCLVPGVQKLISAGIADPKAIALHGHSWGGYQTAFIITQTDIFAAAIAGAPVANMTSAYNGIRWGSGMARQFQYEKSQSRIGTSLIEAPELYMQNSPVFFANRINTPLLIQFGDQDGAVPWYQGIELYLTMRRLNKNCIFLQYNDEPHHLKKYANKLDYTIKMKEFLDHYLKGKPAPDWITKGVPYRKK